MQFVNKEETASSVEKVLHTRQWRSNKKATLYTIRMALTPSCSARESRPAPHPHDGFSDNYRSEMLIIGAEDSMIVY